MMKTTCPNCSQGIEIDEETHEALRFYPDFACPACSAAVPVPRWSVADSFAPPRRVDNDSIPPRHAVTDAGRIQRGMNRNLLMLGVAALLVLGGLGFFLASRKTGDSHVTRNEVRNEIINNSYFTQLIASGVTTKKDLEAIGNIRPWQDGFIGVAMEPLGQEQAKELSKRAGASVLAVSWGGRLFSPVRPYGDGSLVTTDATGGNVEWEQPRTVLFGWGGRFVGPAPVTPAASARNEPAPKPMVEERKGPWIDLFNGRDVSRWKGSKQDDFPEDAWGRSNDDGSLRNYHGRNDQNLETRDKFTDFELEFEWKVSRGGNSGVFYGPREFQLLDDEHPFDWKTPISSAGALYNLLAPDTRKRLMPAGEYNRGKLIVDGGRVEHWINGAKVLEYKLASPELQALVRQGEFKHIPGFCDPGPMTIHLQTHTGNVWFRKIRIRLPR